jgi:hypothetical protein
MYWIAVGSALAASLRVTDGHLIYPLDDAYVHMAIAKNVVLHHVWGVTRYEFASASSSPLWTSLLALSYVVAGVNAVAPLLFNLVSGTLLLVTLYALMRARAASGLLTVVVLAVTVLIAPLATLTIIGMEHTAHALATVWLAFSGAAVVAANRPPTMKELVWLGAVAAVTSGLRYEGLFTLAVIAALLLATKGAVAASVVALLGAAPALVYGLWSVAHGSYVLPNSLLLKGRVPEMNAKALLSFASGSPALHNLLANPHVLLLVVLALILLLIVTTDIVWTDTVYLLVVLVGTALLHMQLAAAGWFYRYEAYLIVLGVAVFGAVAADRLSGMAMTWARASSVRAAVVAILLVVAGFPFASRALNGWRNIPTASSNIYQQQYQMGLFLDRFYRGRSVALNDIGAASYLTDFHLLDIYGLANLDIVRMRRARRYASAEIGASATRQATEVAIIYPSWLGEYGGVPSGWTRVGQWGVRDNVVLGENALAFYAVHDDERSRLAANLRQFASALPAPVLQSGAYLP